MKTVNVAVAVIKIADRVLIAKRANHQHQGGLWEFPGGKIEEGEELLNALQRECHEELDILPISITPLTTIHHQYPDKSVSLHVCLVRDYLGVPFGKEGQPITWAHQTELNNFQFPAANLEILSLL
ncbi:8-oxo-dGTP diphosphatase MutT [Kangiella spongicola]|uniref:8-oxo-dGTP diphosphatase n=1 Tax=Kangiella spongicola TaxID=796379 RepID=A0A318D221_9GAMM|nr:8-oxo-dGTP diphosphatase MutT [Kangiella spongicola]PXF63292.1 8-oxo-dGTP diphosphatase MutT [Kangiella spongicola]